MPRKKGYVHAGGFNIPITTKGPIVSHCLSKVYPVIRAEYPGESRRAKRISAATSHKICG